MVASDRPIQALMSILTILSIVAAAPAGAQDLEGRDHPAFTRMPGFFIDTYEESEFDRHEFYLGEEDEAVEGRKVRIVYVLGDGETSPSELQIIRNFTGAAQAAGGEVLYEDEYVANLRLIRGDQEIWASVEPANQGELYTLTVIERESMRQDVVADAATLGSGLDGAGHVAVYGILFETGSAVLQPDSRPALEQVAELLQQRPELTLYVVGHTDTQGSLETNMALSRDRAASVVDALVADYGVARDRLLPHGVGPLSPVSTNASEGGRQLNRRVELVGR